MWKWRGELPSYPFRWNITRRSELGTLAGDDAPQVPDWLLPQLLQCSARVIARCDNADLCFVGRSPECVFHYLSGLLTATSWAERLILLHFSMYGISEQEVRRQYPRAIPELRSYLAHLALDPESLGRRERPLALVDLVQSGGTLGNLVGVWHSWCRDLAGDWGAVQRKVRIVGLTERTDERARTWRWQQHAPWRGLLERGVIKNVAISPELWLYLSGGHPKTTESYPPERWGDPALAVPQHEEWTRAALQLALLLFDAGRQKDHRARFTQEIAKQSAMQHGWVRALLAELKGGAVAR